jgi:hypothetical protein
MKYKLTLLQKIELPILWIYWKLSVIEDKRSWHEVKKGMEKHTHKFTIPMIYQGYKFMKCEHEGCTVVDPV